MMANRLVGVNFHSSGIADVSLWAPGAQEVALRLDGRNTDLPLEKNNRGFWHLNTNQLKAGDRYRFVLDEKALPDPASLSQPDGVHGYSEAIDLNNFPVDR